MKLHNNLIEGLFQCLKLILIDKLYAHKAIELTFKKNKSWGSRDRGFIAEFIYSIIRYLRLYDKLIDVNFDYSDRNIWKLISAYIYINKLGNSDNENIIKFDSRIKSIYNKIISQRIYKESIPDWLDELGVEEIGEEKWGIEIKALNNPAELCIRVNTIKTSKAQLKKDFEKINIPTHEASGYKDGLIVTKRVNLFRTKEFKNGLFEIQDFSSQLVAYSLDLNPKLKIIDTCAGAGGKTLHIASILNNKGNVIATDIYQHKLDELKRRARRNGIHNITTKIIDKKFLKRNKEKFDRVLIDAPCSGFGVMKRNPDSKWKIDKIKFNSILEDQKEILKNHSKLVKMGGFLIYVTCSIFPSENNFQIEEFLNSEKGKNFNLISEQNISPHKSGFDGFYIAKLERVC